MISLLEQRIHFAFFLLLAFFFAAGCGDGGSDNGGIEISGKLERSSAGTLSAAGEADESDLEEKSDTAISGARITVAATREVATTDSEGRFSLFTTERGPSISLQIQGTDFQASYTITEIPQNTARINLELSYDPASNQVGAGPVTFEDANGAAPSSPTPNPTVNPTPGAPQPTAAPTSAPTVRPTAAPTPQPTPAGNFDANGNTSAFGIPSGTTGNVSRGQSVWTGTCSGCHGSEKRNLSYSGLTNALKISAMSGISLSSQQRADLVAYLNRGR